GPCPAAPRPAPNAAPEAPPPAPPRRQPRWPDPRRPGPARAVRASPGATGWHRSPSQDSRQEPRPPTHAAGPGASRNGTPRWSSRLSLRRGAFSLAEHDELVGRPAGKCLLGTVRPDHLKGVDALDRSQAEVGARVVAAQVTGSRVDPPQPATA